MSRQTAFHFYWQPDTKPHTCFFVLDLEFPAAGGTIPIQTSMYKVKFSLILSFL